MRPQCCPFQEIKEPGSSPPRFYVQLPVPQHQQRIWSSRNCPGNCGEADPAHEEGKKADTQRLDGMDTVHVDKNGEVDLPQEIVIGRTQDLFGPKIYEEIKEDVTAQIAAISAAEKTEVHEQLKNIAGTIKSNIKEKILPQRWKNTASKRRSGQIGAPDRKRDRPDF